MNGISPFNSISNTSFKKRLIINGDESGDIEKAIRKNAAINNLAKGRYDITATIHERPSTKDEIYKHGANDTVFKVYLTAKDTSQKLFDKICEFFTKHSYNPTRNYHSEDTIIQVLSDIKDEHELAKKLNITDY